MIKYLNHQLIKESNIIDVFQYEYWVFTCIKCKCCIFETKTITGESKKNEYYYWMYNDGKFRIPNTAKKLNNFWHFLELTCEEELIKKLLE